MDYKEIDISFICLNSSLKHEEGKLELALPFYSEFGEELPERINLHVKDGVVWQGKLCRASFSIGGLQKMMSYYGLKDCDLALLQYVGSGNFNVKFYNGYGIEMNMLVEDGSVQGNGNFFKIMDLETYSEGELKLPRPFRKTFGHLLSNNLIIELGGGYLADLKYSASKKQIYHFDDFLRKFDIADEYVIFFNYLGKSRFSLAVYDTERCNHFRHERGELRIEDIIQASCNMEVGVVSDVDEDHKEEKEDSFRYDAMSFSVTLKQSDVDQHSPGVYFPRFLWPVYHNWHKRTNVTLKLASMEWKVDILRAHKKFRFGRGWNAFTLDNILLVGQSINFKYVGNSTFEVSV